MRQYNVLVLTDHSKHSAENSIYALVKGMLKHEQCKSIVVSSRGLDENKAFFHNMDEKALYGSKVDENFAFTFSGTFMHKELSNINPLEIDLVFMRLPRPISDEFLVWLEQVFPQAVFVNKPSGILETSSKKYLLNFPDQCPEMRLCTSIEEVLEYANKFPIVLKPLKEYGGKGLLKINKRNVDDGNNVHPRVEYLQTIKTELEKDGYLAMKFLTKVTEGDKRILVVGGEIMAASLRKPAEGSWLCNVAQGGTSHETDITPEEESIIAAISPKLTEAGIVIFGADTLTNDDGKRILSEINTLSIGGFMQAEEQTGKNIIEQTINKIFDYANARS